MLVRIRRTGEIVAVDPLIAAAMLADGTAELLRDRKLVETTTAEPKAERAVTAAENPPRRKGK